MPDENDLINEIVDRYTRNARFTIEHTIKRMMAACESPIERVLVAALIEETYDMGINRCWWSNNNEYFGKEPTRSWDWHGYVQPKAGAYRLDVGLSVPVTTLDGGKNLLFAIECDGHDFHERTKQQAARDKQRDRDLQVAGFRIIRFTGSEIWSDAQECAGQVLQVVEAAFLAAAA